MLLITASNNTIIHSKKCNHASISTQNIPFNWENHISIAAAFINQLITEWDRKLNILHNFKNHRVNCITHIIIAKIAAYIIYSSIHSAKGAREVAVISDITVTGHVDSCLELLNIHQIITGRNAVYNQIYGGSHASAAYAIAWGIKITATVIHAKISALKTFLSLSSGIHSKNGRYDFRFLILKKDIFVSLYYYLLYFITYLKNKLVFMIFLK